jgi:hypothetical protein
MKRTTMRFLSVPFFLVCILAAGGSAPSVQEFPEQKPKFDYMSTFLRGRKPLGLKEDLIMKRLLKQPRANWSIRAGLRHILD